MSMLDMRLRFMSHLRGCHIVLRPTPMWDCGGPGSLQSPGGHDDRISRSIERLLMAGGDRKRSSRKGGEQRRTPASKRSSSSKRSSTAGSSKSSSPKRQYTATTRSVKADRQQKATRRRRDLAGAAVNLPNWVIEGVERVTPKDRVAPTLEALGAASEALADGKYQSAVKHGLRAKNLSPQDPTVRETLGLAAYRLGDWPTALRELRAYRRMAGETTHMPIEMDVLRAQGRSKDVEEAWTGCG